VRGRKSSGGRDESLDLLGGLGQKKEGPREPLADRMRPRTLEEFVGQEHILGEGGVLRKMIESDEIGSLILWGPPGSGKTTLARIIAGTTGAEFVFFSAVTSGVKEVREIVKTAQANRSLRGRKTILFCDEIHRFNKAQQDAFLPHVENGTIILIGSTTENPSFEVVAPLLSRTTVFTLNPLSAEELALIARRALADRERGIGDARIDMGAEALDFLVYSSGGDARRLLNALETLSVTVEPDTEGTRHVGKEEAAAAVQRSAYLYDKAGEEHYNLASAMIKSLRGSDPDASLYWATRMLESGEDPLFIARRLVIFASEDVGLADAQALPLAVAAQQAVHFVGMPEAKLVLAHAVLYLALAPKSNLVLRALAGARDAAGKTSADPVPLHLRNAPTGLMRELGYAKEYRYPHDFPGHVVEEEYLPEKLRGSKFVHPEPRGTEGAIARTVEELERRRRGGPPKD
jgi:putative ATPase